MSLFRRVFPSEWSWEKEIQSMESSSMVWMSCLLYCLHLFALQMADLEGSCCSWTEACLDSRSFLCAIIKLLTLNLQSVWNEKLPAFSPLCTFLHKQCNFLQEYLKEVLDRSSQKTNSDNVRAKEVHKDVSFGKASLGTKHWLAVQMIKAFFDAVLAYNVC